MQNKPQEKNIRPLELEAFRDIDVKEIVIDVVKRDQADNPDHFDINVLMYIRPDVQFKSVEGALQKTCIDIFGAQRDDNIEIFMTGKSDGILLKVEGHDQNCTTVGVAVKWPKSLYFSRIESLKNKVEERLYHHLENARNA